MNVRAAAIPALLYFVLAIVVLPVFPHFTSPNELSRWALTVAVVDEQSVEITNVLARAHLTRIEDVAEVGGRLYSNKAPGMTLLAAPAYLAVRPFTGRASAANIRPTLTAMRIAGSTIPVVLLAFWLAAEARRRGSDAPQIRLTVTALLFATPLFAYGLLFFSHALSACALFGTWALLFSPSRSRGHEIAAGALIGLAVLSEYPNAIPAAVLVACAIRGLRPGGVLRVVAGGAPFAFLLAIYNRVAFGSVLTLSSAHESDPAFRELARSGVFGISLPDVSNLLALLFDPSKGLLIVSPVLVIALFGIGAAWRAMPAAAMVAVLVAPLTILLMIAGYPNWHGGWTVGPRYLVGMLPFAALLIAFVRPSAVMALLTGASAGVTTMMTLVFPFVPPEYQAPWISFSWPLLKDGLVAPNLFHFVWRPLAIGAPFVIVAAALAAATGVRRLPAALAGFAIWIAAGVVIARSSEQPLAARAIVREVYFEQNGAVQSTLPRGPAAERLSEIARHLRRSPPSGWPF